MAGYSGTPLAKKLGIKDHHRVAALGAPATFVADLGELPAGVEMRSDFRGSKPYDVIVAFYSERSKLESDFAKLANRLTMAGGLWIGWPKKASGMATDVLENDVRNIGLDRGLVDNKVCAIDETWSGLRFVRRVVDRK